MKKQFVISVLTACTAAVCLPVLSASAEEAAYSNAYALVQSWAEDYPDYVCGVWTETGDVDQIVIGVIPGEEGEAGKRLILDQIQNDDSVSFVTQQHTMSELRAIMDKITAIMQEGKIPDLYACGVYDDENCVHVSADLENASPELKEFTAQCAEKFGDAVVFEQCSGIEAAVATDEKTVFVRDYPEDMDALPQEPILCYGDEDSESDIVMEIGADSAVVQEKIEFFGDENTAKDDTITIGAIMTDKDGKPLPADAQHNQPVHAMPKFQNTETTSSSGRIIWAVCGFGLLLAVGITGVILRQRRTARQTNTGAVITSGSGSAKATERLVRESAPEPPKELKDKIMEQVKQES
ncbi:MAG: hypothetical protein IKI58_05305 [Oscillospiraceae bacterium]|nr:hypothetical protein [Oscillospiraceae bacterium]